MRGVGLRGLFCLSFMAFSGMAGATVVLPRSLDDLASRSPIVVHGKVVQIDINHEGYRSAVVEPFEIARAPVEYKQEREFIIPLANRAVPFRNIVEVIPSAPELVLSEELVLFLRPLKPERQGPYRRSDGKTLFGLEGFQQGKARVFSDRDGIRRLATWDTVPDVELSGTDLQKQKTTARIDLKSPSKALDMPASIKDNCRSLDSVLNIARGNRE